MGGHVLSLDQKPGPYQGSGDTNISNIRRGTRDATLRRNANKGPVEMMLSTWLSKHSRAIAEPWGCYSSDDVRLGVRVRVTPSLCVYMMRPKKIYFGVETVRVVRVSRTPGFTESTAR